MSALHPIQPLTNTASRQTNHGARVADAFDSNPPGEFVHALAKRRANDSTSPSSMQDGVAAPAGALHMPVDTAEGQANAAHQDGADAAYAHTPANAPGSVSHGETNVRPDPATVQHPLESDMAKTTHAGSRAGTAYNAHSQDNNATQEDRMRQDSSQAVSGTLAPGKQGNSLVQNVHALTENSRLLAASILAHRNAPQRAADEHNVRGLDAANRILHGTNAALRELAASRSTSQASSDDVRPIYPSATTNKNSASNGTAQLASHSLTQQAGADQHNERQALERNATLGTSTSTVHAPTPSTSRPNLNNPDSKGAELASEPLHAHTNAAHLPKDDRRGALTATTVGKALAGVETSGRPAHRPTIASQRSFESTQPASDAFTAATPEVAAAADASMQAQSEAPSHSPHQNPKPTPSVHDTDLTPMPTGVTALRPSADGMPASGATMAQTLVVPFDNPNWMSAFNLKVQAWARQLHDGSHHMQLRLDPPQLGPLHINLSLFEGQAHMFFASHHASVRAALETALPQLQEALAEAGIRLGQAGVGEHGQHQFTPDHPTEAGDLNSPSVRAPVSDNKTNDAPPNSLNTGRTPRGLIDVFA